MASQLPESPHLLLEEFQTLRQLVNEHSGLMLASEARLTVERKLSERVVALGLPGFREYCLYLRNHPWRKQEIERAVELVTTNETYFFREMTQLRAFESEVLPRLQETARPRRRLVIWSAGCSTGEEVYTLAILVRRSGLFSGWDLRIIGNDISRRVLQVARTASYRESSFRAMPDEYAEYFTQSPSTRTVRQDIRDICQFGHFNLLDDARVAMVGRVDAIFCRNVLIYFDQASRRRVIQAFYDRLEPHGYLMLGHSESLLHTSTAFELAQLRGDLAYRKPLRPDSIGPGRTRS
ncbi:MAG: protein-glutamate O-methyltransferase CheR [Polyangiales bacterium]